MQTIYTLCTVLTACAGQQIGTLQPEVHPTLVTYECDQYSCNQITRELTVDANWRWLHAASGSTTNCYTGNQWNKDLCPDPVSCAKNCALEGANYEETYGVQTKDDTLRLQFVKKHQYGVNSGVRLYLMETSDTYKKFNLLNREIAFDVMASEVVCGLNGALYFVEMDADGGKSKFKTNQCGAKYGTGYCDAQCPRDIKFINGEANLLDWGSTSEHSGKGRYGSCCSEFDLWEANKISTAYTSHPCSLKTTYRCETPMECGSDEYRYEGLCDKDGCDWNPYRLGSREFYGPGDNFTVNTELPITVVTQFITENNDDVSPLVEIRREYYQNGKKIEQPPVNVTGVDQFTAISDPMCEQVKKAFKDQNEHAEKGGLKALGESFGRGVVLAMSLWADYTAHALWLDSTYPTDSDPNEPGKKRGTCPTDSGKPDDLMTHHPDAFVKFSNIRFGTIGSTVKSLGQSASSQSDDSDEQDEEDNSGGW